MFRIGIMGCGWIASVLAESLKKLPGYQVAAVASRSKEKADAFANKHCKKALRFGSYDELVQSDIDLVYVATPNNCHCENALTAIRAGKNVLVEKPFAMNLEETETILREAKNHDVLVCEAMWTAFMPIHKKILSWIDSGAIGKVLYISSNLGYEISHNERLTNPEMGGGAYPDLGVYTTHFAMSILGENLRPTSCYARRINTGVEKDVFYTLENEDRSAVATAYVTMCAKTDIGGDIIGTRGRIRVENINNYEKAFLFDGDRNIVESVERDDNAPNGYALEVKACAEAISKGRIQTTEMPWSRTAALMRISDELRRMM